MSAPFQFKYKAGGAVLRDFIKDRSDVSGIRGPVGSGKSVGCVIKMFMLASEQPKQQDGVRRSRFAVIRNTNPELETTTIKTWLSWFPEEVFGKFNWSPPYTHHIRVGDIDMEVIFLALDKPNDVKKLLSLELTGAWINEAREVPKPILDMLTVRIGRFPSKKDGGCVNPCVFMDTNAPDDDHWWPIMAGEAPLPDWIPPEEALMLRKPDSWTFFNQPAGMLETKDTQGNILGYSPNPNAENVTNLTDDYYPKAIKGKTKSWIDVYVMNRLGTVVDGRPVYGMFKRESHVAAQALVPIPGRTVYVGVDFGLTPSAVWAQKDAFGRWLVLGELVATNMGIEKFSQILRAHLVQVFYGVSPELAAMRKSLERGEAEQDGWSFHFTGDPAGDHRAQTDERTPFMICRANGIPIMPAHSNDPALRIDTVEHQLNTMTNGMPGFVLCPKKCSILIKGFEDGYHYKRLPVQGGGVKYSDKPEKNKYSHPHDALQYLLLGAGEGRRVLHGENNKPRVVVARHAGDVFERAGPRQEPPWKRRASRFGL